MGATCPSDNTQATDQSSFWANGAGWDAHKVGWTIAGACTVVVRQFPYSYLASAQRSAHNSCVLDRLSSFR